MTLSPEKEFLFSTTKTRERIRIILRSNEEKLSNVLSYKTQEPSDDMWK